VTARAGGSPGCRSCTFADGSVQLQVLVPVPRISWLGALRLVTSIRPTGTTGPASAIRTVLRFGTYFTSQVARAYLKPTQLRGHTRQSIPTQPPTE
jgi:hypothetical protein